MATLLNAFAKLDYNHAKLSKSLEDAVLVKLDRALELGPKYRASRYLQEFLGALIVFDSGHIDFILGRIVQKQVFLSI